LQTTASPSDAAGADAIDEIMEGTQAISTQQCCVEVINEESNSFVLRLTSA